jgi:hypothetical protein
LRAAGAVVTSSDAALFQLIRDAQHPHFKAISQLVKEHIDHSRQNSLLKLFNGISTSKI